MKQLFAIALGGAAAFMLYRASQMQGEDQEPRIIYVNNPSGAPSSNNGSGLVTALLQTGLSLIDDRGQPVFEDPRASEGSSGISGILDALLPAAAQQPVIGFTGGGRWHQLLGLIRRAESNGNYDIDWGGISAADGPPRQLTTMTIREVLAWQDSIDHKYRSEAAGAYQVLEDTLREWYRRAGLRLDDVFDHANQDRLAVTLLEQKRGLSRFLSGEMSLETAMVRVAQEWASFPVPMQMRGAVRTVDAGQSYYAGDGLNRAHVSVSEARAALVAARGGVLA